LKSQYVNAEKVYGLSTAQFAALNLVKPQTVRKRLCETGSFHGVRPVRLLTNRLAWPSIQVVADVGGGQAAQSVQVQQYCLDADTIAATSKLGVFNSEIAAQKRSGKESA
jgi:hypothetical protein